MGGLICVGGSLIHLIKQDHIQWVYPPKGEIPHYWPISGDRCQTCHATEAQPDPGKERRERLDRLLADLREGKKKPQSD